MQTTACGGTGAESRESVRARVTACSTTRNRPGEFCMTACTVGIIRTAGSYCQQACVTACSTSSAGTMASGESQKKSVLKPLEPAITGPSQSNPNKPNQDWDLNRDQCQD